MVKINIEIEQIENGFILKNSYLDQDKYFKTFQEAIDYTHTCLTQFQEDELK